MVTLLPAGGGDKGGCGGSSVGVAAAVPVLMADVGVGNADPLGWEVGVADLSGVRVDVDVLCPGEEEGA